MTSSGDGMGGFPVPSTGSRIRGLFGVPDQQQEQGFAKSIMGMYYPGQLRVVDAFAISCLTPEEQRAVHSYVMRGIRQALDPRAEYDLEQMYAEDLTDAGISRMPYPIQRAYWFVVTRNSVDAMTMLTSLQAHVGYLITQQSGGSNAMARYQRRMDGRGRGGRGRQELPREALEPANY